MLFGRLWLLLFRASAVGIEVLQVSSLVRRPAVHEWLQIGNQLFCRPVAVFRILGQHAVNDPVQPGRGIWPYVSQLRNRVAHVGTHELNHAFAFVRHPAGKHIEQRASQGVQVRGRRDCRRVCPLFGWHELRSSQAAMLNGDSRALLAGGGIGQTRDSHVQYDHLAFVGDHQVARLDITVNDVLAMSVA